MKLWIELGGKMSPRNYHTMLRNNSKSNNRETTEFLLHDLEKNFDSLFGKGKIDPEFILEIAQIAHQYENLELAKKLLFFDPKFLKNPANIKEVKDTSR
jgi:hypothetical protein